MRVGKGIRRSVATILLELVAAAVPAVLLPPAVSYFPAARRAALLAGMRLPVILVSAALATGILEGILSYCSREKPPPKGANGRTIPSIGEYLLPAAATLVFLLPLLRVWSFAASDLDCAFGIFPWSDGGNYYRGAQELLETGTLDDWNCRRPLNAALLAVRLALAGGSLRGALLLQCVLLSYAVYLFARTVAADLGRGAGLLAFAVVFILGHRYVHWSLSESLGLTLGALAFSLLWAGARERRGLAAMGGVFVLTLALNARAGAFLVLPALVLWAGFVWRRGSAFRMGMAGIAVACILGAFLLNSSLIRLYGGSWGVGHGNFSLTLYGLASGKPGWARIYEDFPESKRMYGDEINEFAYRRATDLIFRNPSLLAEGLAASVRLFLREFPASYRGETSRLYGKVAAWGITIALLAGVARFLLWPTCRGRSGLLLAFIAGFLASVPFLWVDGEARIYLATLPGLAAIAAMGIGGWKREDPVSEEAWEREGPPASEARAAAMAVLLVAAAFVGPAIAHPVTKPPMADPAASVGDSGFLVIRSNDLHIAILPSGAPEKTFVPRVRREDYLRNIPAFSEQEFRSLTGAGTLFYARILNVSPGPQSLYDRFVWVLGPPGMADGPARYLRLEGAYGQDARFFHVRSYSELALAPR